MPARPHPLPSTATTRRTAVGVALAGLAALSACDASRDEPSAASGVSASADPDADLVSGLSDEMTTLLGLAASIEATYPRLGPSVRPWRELHEAHLKVLGDDSTPAPAHRRRFAGPDAALRELRQREQRFQARLVDASVSAQSGPLARVLACMSAGVAQRLVPQGNATQPEAG